jgi:hypothetical protein
MKKPRWYSPQLGRETVRRLYFRARAQGIPMTRLADHIIEQWLDASKVSKCRRDVEKPRSHMKCSGDSSREPGNQ